MTHYLFKPVLLIATLCALLILSLRTVVGIITSPPEPFTQFSTVACVTPCWEGIIPGETHLTDADRILRQQGIHTDVVPAVGSDETVMYTLSGKIVFKNSITQDIYLPELTCDEVRSFIHTYGLAPGIEQVDAVEMYYPNLGLRFHKRERSNRAVYYVDLLTPHSEAFQQYSQQQLYRVDSHFDPRCAQDGYPRYHN